MLSAKFAVVSDIDKIPAFRLRTPFIEEYGGFPNQCFGIDIGNKGGFAYIRKTIFGRSGSF